MSDESKPVSVYLVYEPHRGSASGFSVMAHDFDEAASIYCDLEECTAEYVTVRVVNQTTNEWQDVKMQSVDLQPTEANKYGAN